MNNKWLTKATSHPIGVGVLGTVIGGLILAAILAAIGWLWSNSNFSTNSALVWSGAKAGVSAFVVWLAAPVTVSRSTLWIIVCVGVTGWLLATIAGLRLARDRIVSLNEASINARIGSAFEAHAVNVPQPPPQPVPLSLLAQPLPESLSSNQRRLLQGLYRLYTRGCSMRGISGTLQLAYPAAEKLCEDMATADLVEIGSDQYHGAHVYLTKIGRDYCMRHGLDQA